MISRRLIAAGLLLATTLQAPLSLATCNSSAPARTPTTRFILKGDEALDTETRLSWQRCSLGTIWQESAGCSGTVKLVSLDEALRRAAELGDGWRVPSLVELQGIVETACVEPAINSEVFPGVTDQGEGAAYWTSSSIEAIPSLYYYIDFFTGTVDGHSEGFAQAVRLVRDRE